MTSLPAGMSLDRFKTAQDQEKGGFVVALAELSAGRKKSHWMWYIFPQLRGLGESAKSVFYGLDGVAEARLYWQDDVLRERLAAAADAVYEKACAQGVPLEDLVGQVDAGKLVSCLTLFRHVSPDPAFYGKAEAILEVAACQGFPECVPTLFALREDYESQKLLQKLRYLMPKTRR